MVFEENWRGINIKEGVYIPVLRGFTSMFERLKRKLGFDGRPQAKGGRPHKSSKKDRHKKARITLRIDKGLKDEINKFCKDHNTTYTELIEPYLYDVLSKSKARKIGEKLKRTIR